MNGKRAWEHEIPDDLPTPAGAAPRVPGREMQLLPQNDSDAAITLSGRRPTHAIFWMRAATPTISVSAPPGTSARALLSEIKTRAERLLASGETGSIDLRFLKSMPEERSLLAGLLGQGEVSALVMSIGRSEVQETGIPCVWWVRHFNSDDEQVGESIEVADIPDILASDREGIAAALEALSTRIAARNELSSPPERQPS